MSPAGELAGTWHRVALALDGRPAHPGVEVLWLQGDEWYADIRLPGTPAGGDAAGMWAREWAFAGPARWTPPVMTWTHVFDSDGSGDPGGPGADAGTMTWEGDVLVETGEMTVDGRTVVYREDWHRSDGTPAVVEHRPGGVTVSGRDHRIDIARRRPDAGITAVRLERAGVTWVEIGRLALPAGSGPDPA